MLCNFTHAQHTACMTVVIVLYVQTFMSCHMMTALDNDAYMLIACHANALLLAAHSFGFQVACR